VAAATGTAWKRIHPRITAPVLKGILALIALSCAFLCTFLLLTPDLQGTPKNEIRILIDRAPNTLDRRQPPDAMARRILPLLHEGGYRLEAPRGLDDFQLLPPETSGPSAKPRPALHFRVVKDDLTRGVLYSRGLVDVLFDTLSLSKTGHFRKLGHTVLAPEGHHLSYLGLDLRNPVLARLEVRQAIRDALPLSRWIQQKYFDFVTPLMSSGASGDPEAASRRLDRAGFPKGTDGIRFHLRYLTTPVREGNELAFLVREALRPVGIRIEVIPLESSLFFSRLKRGDFDLFGSRILRPEPDAPVGDLFRSHAPRNYFGYSNPSVDAFLEAHPQAGWPELARWVQEDLPCIPLFTWKHGLLLSSRMGWQGGGAPESLDDSFRFLSLLQIN
jgi:ABC-type transport system substrate-binding protein